MSSGMIIISSSDNNDGNDKESTIIGLIIIFGVLGICSIPILIHHCRNFCNRNENIPERDNMTENTTNHSNIVIITNENRDIVNIV